MRYFRAVKYVLAAATYFTAFLTSLSAETIVIDFESLPYLANYGASYGNTPGDLVLSQEGVDVRLRQYRNGSFTHASVGGFTDRYFESTPMSISNINLEFDLSNLGFDVHEVSFQYVDTGGTVNLGVNSQVVDLADMQNSPAVLGGSNVTVAPPALGKNVGTVTVRDFVRSVTVGGQQFGIDNVTIVFDAPARGDFNWDGSVDVADYALWRVTYGLSRLLAADGNRDGIVNAADYTVWRDAYESAASSAPTPEPSSLLLAAAILSYCVAKGPSTRLANCGRLTAVASS